MPGSMKAFASLAVVLLAGSTPAETYSGAIARLPAMTLPFDVPAEPPERSLPPDKVTPPDQALVPKVLEAAKAFEACRALAAPGAIVTISGRLRLQGGVVALIISAWQPGSAPGDATTHLVTLSSLGWPVGALQVGGPQVQGGNASVLHSIIGDDLNVTVSHQGTGTPSGQDAGGQPPAATWRDWVPLGTDGHFGTAVPLAGHAGWYVDRGSGERLRLVGEDVVTKVEYQVRAGKPIKALPLMSGDEVVAVVAFPREPNKLYRLQWALPGKKLRCLNADGTAQIFVREE